MKVLSVSGQPDTDSFGNLSAFVTVEGVDGSVLLRKKAPFPQPGEEISDDYQVVEKTANSGKSYKKLERPQQPTGHGGGPRPEDPKRAARITRMHSQQMAIDTLTLARSLGIESLNGFETTRQLVDVVKQIADVYDADAEAAAK